MSNKDIKLKEYINSLPRLTPQERLKLAASATSVEDVSIMLKSLPFENETINIPADSPNSVWQQSSGRVSDCYGYSSSGPSSEPACPSSEVKKGVVNPLAIVDQGRSESLPEENEPTSNFFAKDSNRKNVKSPENKYHKNGKLKEAITKNYNEKKEITSDFSREYNEEGVLTKSTTKDYDENGNLTGRILRDYSDDGKNVIKEVSEDYDRNNSLMLKTAVHYKYDKGGNVILECGENYDTNDKPRPSYRTEHILDEQGRKIKAITQRFDSKGEIVSTEVNKLEFIKKENTARITKSNYDKSGKLYSKTVEDLCYDKKGNPIQTNWRYFEKNNLKLEVKSELDNHQSEAKTVKTRYENGSIAERMVDENNEALKTTVETFKKGKLNSKKVTVTNYDQNGTPEKTTTVVLDGKGNILSKNTVTNNFDSNGKQTGFTVENFDKKNQLINKTVNSVEKDQYGYRTAETSQTYDAGGNLTSTVKTKYKKHGGVDFISSQIKTNCKDGQIISTEVFEESEVAGEYNYRLEDADGIVSEFVDVKKFENGAQKGISIVKKLKSPEGSQTDYQYSEDNKGSKKLLYKITGPDGKEILSIEREYQKIGENSAVSMVNGSEYKIEIQGDIINVFDVKNNKTTRIDLNELVDANNVEVKNNLKSQPGDVLISLSQEAKKIGADIDNGHFASVGDFITVDGKSSTVAHELGHSIDSAPNEIGENEFKISQNKEFLDQLKKEMEDFKNASSESEQYSFSYLEKPSEFVAETKMVTTTSGDKKWNAMREFILMKYFPKTLSIASKLLNEAEENTTPKKVL